MPLQCFWKTTYNPISVGGWFTVTMFLDATIYTILSGVWKYIENIYKCVCNHTQYQHSQI
jgi:hypothetical protein